MFLFSQPRELPDRWQHDMFEEHTGGHRQSDAVERSVESNGKLVVSNLEFGVSDLDIKVINYFLTCFNPLCCASLRRGRS